MHLFFFAPVLLGLIAIGYVVYGVLMAVDAAKSEQWAWFALILLFMFPAALLYHLIAKDDAGNSSQARRRALRREADLRREIDALRAKVDRLERGRT